MPPQSCRVLVDHGIHLRPQIPDRIFDQPNIGQRIGIRQKQIPPSEQGSVAASPLKVESDIHVQATTGKPFQSHSERIGRAPAKAEQVATHSLPGVDDDREP